MSARPYLTCQELITFLGDYLDGILPPDLAFEFERHLKVCPSCVAYVATYQETVRIARASVHAPSLEIADPPEELVVAILAARGR